MISAPDSELLEQELIQSIKRLNAEQLRKVLAFVHNLEPPPSEKTYTARELLRLPLEERNRIVKSLLERTLNDDIELFEANQEADFDDE